MQFTLTHGPSHLTAPPPKNAEVALEKTEAFWTVFSERCPRVGTWTPEVKRSLITLKALTYMPTGGIVAAATTSLPEDPRVVGTVAAIERHLVRDGLVLRYDTGAGEGGLPPGEGAFLACSFWLADVLVLLGRHDDARRLFERLRALCNDVGLLAEECDPLEKRMLGNFPQAFNHIGLINTALNLTRIFGPAEDRSEHDDDARLRSRSDG